MDDRDAPSYGETIAEIYDWLYLERMDPTVTVDMLASIADGGPALELGIGTGRVALPLAARAVAVSGIDASPAMVAKLRQKPGGEDIPVHMGDFVDVDAPGLFTLVYVPFTTFFALTSQAQQIRCLRNVAARLQPGGAFVLDAFVPDVTRYREGQAMTVLRVESELVMLDVAHHDSVAQTLRARHVILSEADGVRFYPVFIRYCWPAELDMMALAAGLELEVRYGDYDRRPFDWTSQRHVSIYRRPADG